MFSGEGDRGEILTAAIFSICLPDKKEGDESNNRDDRDCQQCITIRKAACGFETA
jgi:hypothetical protein